MEIHSFLARVFSGLAYGGIYGLFGLSLVLLFRSNRLFNAAQTEIANFIVIIMFFLLRKMAYFPALAWTILISFMFGIFLHVFVMRTVTSKRRVLHSNEFVVTLGLFSIFNSLSGYIFGDEPERFPTPFGDKLYTLFGVAISFHTIVILSTSIVLALACFCFFRFTRLGLILEAISENLVAARLRGINVSNYLAVAWGITIIISVIGGILIAPVLFVSSVMLTQIFSYSLIAVVIGGLESPFGALVGGMIVGVTETLAATIPWIGPDLKFLAVFALLLVVLVVRPRGIWGRQEQRRV